MCGRTKPILGCSRKALNARYLEESHLLVCSVERVGIVCLCTHHAGHSADEAHVHAHLESLVEGVDVA